jgi:hypothetical protein
MSEKNESSEDKISKFFEDIDQVTHALQLGIKAALLKHKQAGNPICEWKDGKVVWIPAEKIPVNIEIKHENDN